MPDVLGEDLLIIGKESSYFDDTRGRPDLIALDKKGNIVVIELIRDDSGISVEWQAIKYTYYLSKFKASDIIDLYLQYVEKSQRLILVSHRFAKEVTSAVSWLIDKHEMDIRVVQLIPYYDKDRLILISLSTWKL